MAADHPEIAEIDVNPLLVAGTAPGGRRCPRDPGDAGRRPRRERGVGQWSRRGARTLHLDAVFVPRSVAVVGASEDATKWGGSVMRNLLDGGFDGALYPINPRGGTIFGVPAYRGARRPAGDARPRHRGTRRRAGGGHRRGVRPPRRARGDRHRRRLRRSRRRRSGAAAGARPGRRRGRRHARRPQLHGRALHELSPQCRRLRDAAAGAGPLSVISQSGQHRHAVADDRGAPRHRCREVREQRQSGDHRRQRPARVPGGRPTDRRRGDVPRGDGRRTTLLRACARDDAAQARRS